jgi:hypothetical protein
MPSLLHSLFSQIVNINSVVFEDYLCRADGVIDSIKQKVPWKMLEQQQQRQRIELNYTLRDEDTDDV